jgi:hypothetical protein
LVAIVSGLFLARVTHVWANEPKFVGPDPQLYQAAVNRAIRFLAMSQSPVASISLHIGIGPTALAALGLLRSGRAVDAPQVAKALKYLESEHNITSRVVGT